MCAEGIHLSAGLAMICTLAGSYSNDDECPGGKNQIPFTLLSIAK